MVYGLAGICAVAMLAIFIQAIRLCYRIEALSPDLRNTSGIPRNAMLPYAVINWKVPRDAETQALRRRMNLLLLADAAGFALLCLWIWWVRQG